MTKRQCNVTYLTLAEQISKLRGEYWRLVNQYLREKGTPPFNSHEIDWVSYSKGRVGQIKELRWYRDYYKGRISKMKKALSQWTETLNTG